MKAGRSVCLFAVTLWLVADSLGFAPRRAVYAQNTVVAAPHFRFGDNSFENVGFGFGQPLGGNNAGAQLGFSILGGGGALNFNLTAAQGSSRSMVGGAPFVTVANGGTGIFMHSIQRPFVVGFTPVVGGWSNAIVVPPRIPPYSMGPVVSPLQERVQRLANGESPSNGAIAARKAEGETNESETGIERHSTARRSSAEQPDISVAEIRRQQDALDAAQEATIAGFVSTAREAEATGDLALALKLIDKARRASRGAQRRACEDKIRALRARIRAAQDK